jgi:hypothetical protein
MVSEEIRRMQATMDGLVREQADRRALRERQGEEIKARSQEYMTKQVQAAERYVQLRRELGQREREAEEEVAKEDFEPEEFAESDEDTPRPPAPPVPVAARPPAPPAPPVPVATRPARPARRPHADETEDDDEDFLNNRWWDDE